jgi:hypothetical protein
MRCYIIFWGWGMMIDGHYRRIFDLGFHARHGAWHCCYDELCWTCICTDRQRINVYYVHCSIIPETFDNSGVFKNLRLLPLKHKQRFILPSEARQRHAQREIKSR